MILTMSDDNVFALPSSECPVCFRNDSVQKFLSCKHYYCERCIESLARPDGEERNPVVPCPLCRKNTILSLGGHAQTLKTKFFVELLCDDCSAKRKIEKMWFCSNCDKSVCGDCGLKKHRNHNLSEWEQYEGPARLIGFIENIIDQTKAKNIESELRVKEFCKQLQDQLLLLVSMDKDLVATLEKVKQRLRNHFVDTNCPTTFENVAEIETGLRFKTGSVGFNLIANAMTKDCKKQKVLMDYSHFCKFVDIEGNAFIPNLNNGLVLPPVNKVINFITDPDQSRSMLETFEISKCVNRELELWNELPSEDVVSYTTSLCSSDSEDHSNNDECEEEEDEEEEWEDEAEEDPEDEEEADMETEEEENSDESE